MFYRRVLSVIVLFSTLLAFDAKACSSKPLSHLFSFADMDRRVQRPIRVQRPMNDQGASISLIKTVLLEERDFTLEEIRSLKLPYRRPGTFQLIEFEALEVIFGHAPSLEKHWYPKLSDETIIQEREYAEASRPFAFWDRWALSWPIAFDQTVSSGGLCYPDYMSSLSPDTTYISFSGLWSRSLSTPVSGLEPVSSSEHSFVKAIKSYVAGRESPALRKAKDYFSEMRGFAEIEIVECPFRNRDGRVNVSNHAISGRDGYETGRRGERRFSEIRFQLRDAFNMVASDISMIQFSVYRSQIENYQADRNESVEFTCTVGERFLVLDRVSDHPRRPDGSLNNGKAKLPPSQRFLRYKSGNNGGAANSGIRYRGISSDEVLTRIEFAEGAWPTPEEMKKIIVDAVCKMPENDSSLCADPHVKEKIDLETPVVCTPQLMECDGITRRNYWVTDFGEQKNRLGVYGSTPSRLANVNSECALKSLSATIYLPKAVSWREALPYWIFINNGMTKAVAAEKIGAIRAGSLDETSGGKRLRREEPSFGYVEYTAKLMGHPKICEP